MNAREEVETSKRFPDVEINGIPFSAPGIIEADVHPILFRYHESQPGPGEEPKKEYSPNPSD
jgi:hypothetical protein